MPPRLMPTTPGPPCRKCAMMSAIVSDSPMPSYPFARQEACICMLPIVSRSFDQSAPGCRNGHPSPHVRMVLAGSHFNSRRKACKWEGLNTIMLFLHARRALRAPESAWTSKRGMSLFGSNQFCPRRRRKCINSCNGILRFDVQSRLNALISIGKCGLASFMRVIHQAVCLSDSLATCVVWVLVQRSMPL
jgi:hypothetical protein